MKKLNTFFAFIAGATVMFFLLAFNNKKQAEPYVLQHENEIAAQQPGPHDGGGSTVAYPFFEKIKDFKMAFRKRVLKPGSSIGYHLQETDEVYYILSGNGEVKMNRETFNVKGGDAILTRPGSSHGLKPTGNDDLTVIIAYQLK